MRRVVVTGMGAVTPVGNDVSEMWRNIKDGVSGIGPVTKFDASDMKVKVAAEVKGFDPEKYMTKKEARRYDPYCLYALAAAQEAFDQSGLNEDNIDFKRFGTIVGSGIGGLQNIEEQVIKLHEKGPGRITPLFIPMVISNMAAGNISIRFGTKGLSSAVITACSSGTHAIGEAFRNIKYGYLDACFAGGAEAPIVKIGIAGFANLTALSEQDGTTASRPFDKRRDGFVAGEGAGILILEEMEHAIKRGATIFGEVVGYGATSDAYHMTAPSPEGEGATDAILLAMEEAGVAPEQIGYINAHGTSTPLNDLSETKAIKQALGEASKKVAVSSTKSMIGHLLGAAGAVEGIISLKALQEGFLPPTINYEEKDPECDLDYVPNVGRNAKIQYALSNSFGFGGHNGVVCFKRWDS